MIVSEEKKWWQELAEAATNPSLATFLRVGFGSRKRTHHSISRT